MPSSDKPRIARRLWALGLFAAGIALGAGVERLGLPGKVRSLVFGPPPPPAARPAARPVSLSERAEVPLEALDGKRVLVLLCAGQSNAANYGDTRGESINGVYNFYLGKLYRAKDPLLGGGGTDGSVWTRLGDLVVEGGLCDAVVIAPVAVSSTQIAAWAPGGHLHPLLLSTIEDLRDRGLPPSALLFQQGESDAVDGTRAADYAERFGLMLEAVRGELPDTPILVATATLNAGRVSPEIRGAQSRILDAARGVYPGPDADSLVGECRNAGDKTHLSGRGLRRCAELWLDALKRAPVVAREGSARDGAGFRDVRLW